MRQVVWFSTFLILVLSFQGFDAIVEGGQESAPGVNDTKNDQSHTQLTKSQDSNYLQVHLEVNFIATKNSFHLEKDEKLRQMNENSTNVDPPSLASNDKENRTEDKLPGYLPPFAYSAMENRMEDKLAVDLPPVASNDMENRTEDKFSGDLLPVASNAKENRMDDKLAVDLPPVAFSAMENRMEDKLAQRQNATTCTRGMAYNAARPRLEVMRDNTLNRDILCDTQTDGGGWIIIQRRTKGDVDFYRNWTAYKNGFGSPPGDFWLGNDEIHELTNKDAYELRVELKSGNTNLFALYSSFKIESEANNYILRLGSHSGTLGEDSTDVGFSAHNGNSFSTYDRDNDKSKKNCAEIRHGGWWYGHCYWVHLNGVWGKRDWHGMLWMDGQQTHYAKSTQMMIRRIYM